MRGVLGMVPQVGLWTTYDARGAVYKVTEMKPRAEGVAVTLPAKKAASKKVATKKRAAKKTSSKKSVSKQAVRKKSVRRRA